MSGISLLYRIFPCSKKENIIQSIDEAHFSRQTKNKHHNETILVSFKQITMPTLTVKNIPDALYSRLKEAAQAHHRSMNSEILYCVEQTLGAQKIPVTEHITRARKLRMKSANHPLTDSDIFAAKNEGRL